ncbi:hypothetical protein ACFL6S_09185 [Candidatus Poribacteria bacterium]
MSEVEVKFCPLLTIVNAGQANYMVCQTNCTFYIEDECVFITTARLLKEVANPKVIEMVRKGQTDGS